MGRAPAAIRWHVRLEARLFAGVTLIIGLALTAIAVAAHDIVTSNAAAPLTAEDEAALRLGLIWITAFTFVLAAAAAAVFSHHLTTPLRTIETAAREIAAGRWDRPVPAPGGTEAAVIAAAFNEMSASLTHWHSEASSLAERERAREALRRSEERFHLATKATNDIIWDWDLVTNELWWSDGAPALLGRIDGTPSVERWRELIHPDDRDRVVAGLDAFLKTDEPVWSAEYRLRRAGGAYAWILDRAHVTRDAERHPQRMIGSWMDISERKEAERMKSDFVSFVSHQLRTPLSGVNWMLELATDSAGPAFRKVLSCGQRAYD
jgi:PAS domain S-box-containing protein